jgi:hypothetical protein
VRQPMQHQDLAKQKVIYAREIGVQRSPKRLHQVFFIVAYDRLRAQGAAAAMHT